MAGPDSEADFDEFFDEFVPVVIGLVVRLTGNHPQAEDIAIEAFARAYARWNRIGPMSYRRPWVLRVATNLVIADARHHARRPALAAAPSAEFEETTVLRMAVLDALARLPRRQREAVALRYLADLPENDVADAMGVTAGSVKTHLSRGLAALRRIVPDGDQEGSDFGFAD